MIHIDQYCNERKEMAKQHFPNVSTVILQIMDEVTSAKERKRYTKMWEVRPLTVISNA